MDCSKYNIAYKEISVDKKPLFIFINHRVSIVCWNKIREILGKCDVVTLDSHRDFRNGFIFKLDPDETFSSKHHKGNHPHFTLCEEFINWDLSDNEQNRLFIKEGKKFVGLLNDNFIDVAFMKDLVGDVFWYYSDTENDSSEGGCEDINGKIHKYHPLPIKEFKIPKRRFILDIDLDFFVENPALKNCTLMPQKKMKKYLNLIRKIMDNPNCLAITLALEPGCCGGKENCLKISKKLSNIVEIGLNKEIEKFL
ncbi:MAG: UPF0489 family protein [Nanoarchaeota archaeon]|nr:UPF0489 family protein [Nanoarchaeota archaeon]